MKFCTESPLRVGSWYLGFAVAAEMFERPAEGRHFPKLSAEQRRSSMFQAQRRVESLPGCWEERLLSRLVNVCVSHKPVERTFMHCVLSG